MKTLIFLFLICSCFLCTPSFTYADNIFYAKIKSDNVYFYSNPIKSEENELFLLPNTYFVMLINNENDNFYYAKYKDLYGYVLKQDVNVMDGIPTQPYANASFRVFSPDGLGLYTTPNINDSYEIIEIPYLAENLTYYGSVTGQQAIPEKSTTWYYCNFNDENDYFGYVYSVFCDKLTTIQDNNESFNIISNPVFVTTSKSSQLSQSSMIFIIIGVSIPCLIVIYLLVKPTLLRDKSLNPTIKVRKKHHGDYYEFDDSDLT